MDDDDQSQQGVGEETREDRVPLLLLMLDYSPYYDTSSGLSVSVSFQGVKCQAF